MGAGASQPNRVETVGITPVRKADAGLSGTPARSPTGPQTDRSVRPVVGRGQWSYQDVNNAGLFQPFTEDANERFEMALKDGQTTVEIAIGRTLFRADLVAYVMQVGNGQSGPRRIRREVIPGTETEGTSPTTGAAPGGDSGLAANGSGGGENDVIVNTTHGRTITLRPSNAKGRPQSCDLSAAARAHTSLVYCAAFSLDGKHVASGSRDGTFRYWEIDTGYIRRQYEPIEGVVLNCAIAPNSSFIATGSDDKILRVYNENSDQPVWTKVAHSHKVYGLSFTCDSRFILTGSMDSQCKLWDVQASKLVTIFREQHSAAVFSVTCSPYTPNIAISGADDKTLCSYDLRSTKVTATFRGHTATLWATDIRFDEAMFASAGMDGKALLWDPRNPSQPVATAADHGVAEIHKIEFCSSGSRLLTCARDSTWRLWAIDQFDHPETPAAPCRECVRVRAHEGTVFAVTHSAVRNQIMSIGSDAMIRLWDVPGL